MAARLNLSTWQVGVTLVGREDRVSRPMKHSKGTGAACTSLRGRWVPWELQTMSWVSAERDGIVGKVGSESEGLNVGQVMVAWAS